MKARMSESLVALDNKNRIRAWNYFKSSDSNDLNLKNYRHLKTNKSETIKSKSNTRFHLKFGIALKSKLQI
jgi:hypothetical protein